MTTPDSGSRETPDEPREPDEQPEPVADPAVLAERRARRAEQAQEAHARRAAELEEALGTAQAELHRSTLRLERALEERARVDAELGARERELGAARQRAHAEERMRLEEVGEARERLAQAESEVASLRRRLSAGAGDADLEGRVQAAERGREAAERRWAAAEVALGAVGAAAAQVEQLVTATSQVGAQIAVLEARRRTAELSARRAEEARDAFAREAADLRAEAERGAAALLAAEDRLTSLGADLAAAREDIRRRTEREREAQRVGSELVATASAALADAERRLADAEAPARAQREEAASHREAREAAERRSAEAAQARDQAVREAADLREELQRAREAAAERAPDASEAAASEAAASEALAAEARIASHRDPALRQTSSETLLARTVFPPDRPAIEARPPRPPLPHPRASSSSAQPTPPPPAPAPPAVPVVEEERRPSPSAAIAPGHGWLARALAVVAARDPAAGGRLALALLPLHGLRVKRAANWDLMVGPGNAWKVASVPGRLAVVTALDAPRGRAAPFRVEADPVVLAALLGGARPRRARRRGRLATKGSTLRVSAALRAVAKTPLDLRAAARAGLWLDPALAYLALTQAIAPAWTAGHHFVVAHELTGGHAGTWFVRVEGAAPPAVAMEPPDAVDATVRCSSAAFLPLLVGEPLPRSEKVALRGDLRAIALLREWVARAQRGS